MPAPDPRIRMSVRPGAVVDVVQKQDQKTGRVTRGVVQEILTNAAFHPYGIKVRLSGGIVGRVKTIIGSPRP